VGGGCTLKRFLGLLSVVFQEHILILNFIDPLILAGTLWRAEVGRRWCQL
jgi:hypothetical protein